MNRVLFLLVALAKCNVDSVFAHQLTGENDELTSSDATRRNRVRLRNSSSRRLEKDEVEFTKLLMNDISTRQLELSETCLPNKSLCGSNTSPCCQGGCTSSKTCFCQLNDSPCFNVGKQDSFCCSNKCGSDGRCECIAEGGPCSAGEFCCDGMSCSDGKCVKTGSNDEATSGFFSKAVTCRKPGKSCFNPGKSDSLCCSGECASNGKCSRSTGGNSNNSNYNGVPLSFGTKTTDTPRPTAKRELPKPSPRPTPEPQTAAPTPKSTPKPQIGFTTKTSGGCASGEVKLTVEIKTDKWGGDTSWFLAGVDSIDKKILKVNNGTYATKSVNSVDTCLTEGDYNFTVYDEYGDGLCCTYGDGHVRVLLDDREVLNTKSFQKMLSEIIKVGYDPTPMMGERDLLYLEAHNYRRKEWHESNNVSYVPLVWSHQLAFESRLWAEKLLVNCSIAGIEHEHNVPDGENLAKNVGLEETWGQLYLPDKIVGRWVEWEINRPYPGNAHLTQALWRPSKYLGCGESEKDFRNGKCRVQVCRYSRAGNCDMARYNVTYERNWLQPMIRDTSRCGPNCAPEGCY